MLSRARYPRPVSLPASFTLAPSRKRVLEAALHLFAARGYDGTSVRDIAAFLELRPSALYAHFPTKDHVLAELIFIGHRSESEALTAALASVGSDSVARISALVRAVVHWTAENPHLAVVMYDDLHAISPALTKQSLDIRNSSAALLLGIVEAGIGDGKFTALHPMTTAAAIGAMGIRIPYWYPPQLPRLAIDVAGLADAQVDLALRMLGAKTPVKRERGARGSGASTSAENRTIARRGR